VKWLIFVLLGLFCLFIIVLLCPSFFFVGTKAYRAHRCSYLSQFPLPLAFGTTTCRTAWWTGRETDPFQSFLTFYLFPWVKIQHGLVAGMTHSLED